MSTKCGSMCGVFACGMVNLLMIIMCLKLALVSYIDYNPFHSLGVAANFSRFGNASCNNYTSAILEYITNQEIKS